MNELSVAKTTAILVSVLFSGYNASLQKSTANDLPYEVPRYGSIVYSNMNDAETQHEVLELFRQHGIDRKQLVHLFKQIHRYYAHSEGRFQSGFAPLQTTTVDYSSVSYHADHEEYDANCRLTAFLLMKENISISTVDMEQDPFLMFDMDAIHVSFPHDISALERTRYQTLFHSIAMEKLPYAPFHAEKIQEYWQTHGITVASGSPSLISVYSHRPCDDLRFVSHAGVLVNHGHGLFFFEKYDAEYPYQITRFNDRKELVRCLLARRSFYGDDSSALPPIIIENGKPLSIDAAFTP